MSSSPDLFTALGVGAITVTNRVAMAPLTRSRANEAGVQPAIAAQYYAQRASAGLLITEATNISPQARGYAYTPGIYSDEQVAAWKRVTQAVHAAGGKIVLQLWHVGRISHESLQPNGQLPVAPSAIRPKGQAFTTTGMKPHPTPRALSTEEIPNIIEDYRHAARQAKAAGFDGVEVHAANNYLLEQFIRDSTNKRNDAYGGSIENRTRLVFEVTQAVAEVFGGNRVGIRLSPLTRANGSELDSTPQQTYEYLARRLSSLKLAYVHCVEGQTGGAHDVVNFDFQSLRRLAGASCYIANNGYDLEKAQKALENKQADMIAFGKAFISNPDLVHRLRNAQPLTPVDPSTFYGGGAKGYTDWPTFEAVEASH